MSQQTNNIRIAVSKGGPEDKYRLYGGYILRNIPGAEIVDMDGLTAARAVELLESCQGLVLTGGRDVFPGLYGKKDAISLCGKTDTTRDALEISLIQKALGMKLPIFAICRGAQLLNVVRGGDLIIDIPTQHPSAVIHRNEDPTGAWHEVLLEPGSELYKMVGGPRDKVNSFHHQAVNHLSDEFMSIAKDEDGIIEAYTWKHQGKNGFLMAVQWHPERMDNENPLSGKIVKGFIEAVLHYKK